MKTFLILIAGLTLSSSMAFAHCGSCGTEDSKAKKSCSKKHKKGKALAKKHKGDKDHEHKHEGHDHK